MIGWVDVVGVEVRACLERSYTSYLPCSPCLLTADRNMGAIYDNPIEVMGSLVPHQLPQSSGSSAIDSE